MFDGPLQHVIGREADRVPHPSAFQGFVQGGQVKGREVVSIVPAPETKLVQKDTPPPSGGSKIETLKGGDYMRLWINKGGSYYLVHFAKA